MPTSKILGQLYTNLYQEAGIKFTGCKLPLTRDHFISLVFSCLHLSHDQPIFIWQTFPWILKLFRSCSVNYFPPTIQIQLKFNYILLTSTQSFLVSCFLVFQFVTYALCHIP